MQFFSFVRLKSHFPCPSISPQKCIYKYTYVHGKLIVQNLNTANAYCYTIFSISKSMQSSIKMLNKVHQPLILSIEKLLSSVAASFPQCTFLLHVIPTYAVPLGTEVLSTSALGWLAQNASPNPLLAIPWQKTKHILCLYISNQYKLLHYYTEGLFGPFGLLWVFVVILYIYL